MKKQILLFSVISFFLTIFILSSCDNYITRNLGGTETVNLPKGRMLVNATWKENNIWLLTKPMPKDHVPDTLYFTEKSNAEVLQGEVIIIESK